MPWAASCPGLRHALDCIACKFSPRPKLYHPISPIVLYVDPLFAYIGFTMQTFVLRSPDHPGPDTIKLHIPTVIFKILCNNITKILLCLIRL